MKVTDRRAQERDEPRPLWLGDGGEVTLEVAHDRGDLGEVRVRLEQRLRALTDRRLTDIERDVALQNSRFQGGPDERPALGAVAGPQFDDLVEAGLRE